MRTRIVAGVALVLMAAAAMAAAAESGRYTGETDQVGAIRITVAGDRVTRIYYTTGIKCVPTGEGVDPEEEPYDEDVERSIRPRVRINGGRFRHSETYAKGTRSYTITGRVSGRTIRGTIREYKLTRERDGDLPIVNTCRGRDTYVARLR